MARPKRLLPKLAVERPNVACPRMLRAMQGIDEPTKLPSLSNVGKTNWLVVSTPLKNISQWEGLSHTLWKIKNVPNHQPAMP